MTNNDIKDDIEDFMKKFEEKFDNEELEKLANDLGNVMSANVDSFVDKYIPSDMKESFTPKIMEYYMELYEDLSNLSFFNLSDSIVKNFEKEFDRFERLLAGKMLGNHEMFSNIAFVSIFEAIERKHSFTEKREMIVYMSSCIYKGIYSEGYKNLYDSIMDDSVPAYLLLNTMNNYVKLYNDNKKIIANIIKNINRYLTRNLDTYIDMNIDDIEIMDLPIIFNTIIKLLNEDLDIEIAPFIEDMLDAKKYGESFNSYIMKSLDDIYGKLKAQKQERERQDQITSAFLDYPNLNVILANFDVTTIESSESLVRLNSSYNDICLKLNPFLYSEDVILAEVRAQLSKSSINDFNSNYKKIIYKYITNYIYNYMINKDIITLSEKTKTYDFNKIYNYVEENLNDNVDKDTFVKDTIYKFVSDKSDYLINEYLTKKYDSNIINLIKNDIIIKLKKDIKEATLMILDGDDTFKIMQLIEDTIEEDNLFKERISNINVLKEIISRDDKSNFELAIKNGLTNYKTNSEKYLYLKYVKSNCIISTDTKNKLAMDNYINLLLEENERQESRIIEDEIRSPFKVKKGGYILFTDFKFEDPTAVSKKYSFKEEKIQYYKYLRESLELLIVNMYLDLDPKEFTTLYTEKYITIDAIKIKDKGFNSRFKVRLVYNNASSGNVLVQKIFDRTNDYNRSITEFANNSLSINNVVAEKKINSSNKEQVLKYYFSSVERLTNIYKEIFNNLDLTEDEKNRDLDLLKLIYGRFYSDVISYDNANFQKRMLTSLKNLTTNLSISISEIKEKANVFIR